MNTIKELIEVGRTRLAQCGSETPRLDAEVLLSWVLDCPRILFYSDPERAVSPEAAAEYRECIERRARLEPVAYIIGKKEFMGLSFQVSPDVLIPRPDTESLVETVIEKIIPRIRKDTGHPCVLDLCTGSGAIGLSLKYFVSDAALTLSDISGKALRVAAENARNLGFSDINMVESDLFEELLSEEPFDLIVSNPPYIPDRIIPTLQRDIADYEPVLALSGGADGYAVYERIAREAGRFLRKGGAVVLEVGNGQEARVAELLVEQGFGGVEMIPDLTGAVRGVAAWKE
ncbi:peptide chain release factor N(5)-glutamine methyltransferase [Eubacterium sp. 1001713B170207_170306_E7]|uniref:peptide chain release factor N(5)-glutamine methyltransferase n=1 Tax=Eubacterium sp. 1001713B170207_170306_E7 TaxID=2787097 RepID=UPI0018990DAB|nr:peptide chain release factor N(5)-glutamine methyltransferase [Eubacterium sp. 1001713B170207_170306_E7]